MSLDIARRTVFRPDHRQRAINAGQKAADQWRANGGYPDPDRNRQ
jgi:hypothetical protein